jgi:hypothetical protein
MGIFCFAIRKIAQKTKKNDNTHYIIMVFENKNNLRKFGCFVSIDKPDSNDYFAFYFQYVGFEISLFCISSSLTCDWIFPSRWDIQMEKRIDQLFCIFSNISKHLITKSNEHDSGSVCVFCDVTAKFVKLLLQILGSFDILFGQNCIITFARFENCTQMSAQLADWLRISQIDDRVNETSSLFDLQKRNCFWDNITLLVLEKDRHEILPMKTAVIIKKYARGIAPPRFINTRFRPKHRKNRHKKYF